MKHTPQSALARRYLLDEVDEIERTAIEMEYLRDPEALNRIAAAEDELIEAYVDGELDPDARARFERVYMAVPRHRLRVAAVRRLSSGVTRRAPRVQRTPWFAIAAAAAILVVGLWIMRPLVHRSSLVPDSDRTAGSQPVDTRAAARPGTPGPRVFAVTLSALAVRGPDSSPPVVIPSGTDVLSLQLQADSVSAPLVHARASVRVAGAGEVWRGAAATDKLPGGAFARIDIPARLLQANDYIVELIPTDADGVQQQETYQYFLRVRER